MTGPAIMVSPHGSVTWESASDETLRATLPADFYCGAMLALDSQTRSLIGGGLDGTDFVAWPGARAFEARSGAPLGQVADGSYWAASASVNGRAAKRIAEAASEFLAGRPPRGAPKFDPRFSFCIPGSNEVDHLVLAASLFEMDSASRAKHVGPLLKVASAGPFRIL